MNTSVLIRLDQVFDVIFDRHLVWLQNLDSELRPYNRYSQYTPGCGSGVQSDCVLG